MLFHLKNWQVFQVEATSSLMNVIMNSQAKFSNKVSCTQY